MMIIVIPAAVWEQTALNGCIRCACTDIKNRSDVTVKDSAKQVV